MQHSRSPGNSGAQFVDPTSPSLAITAFLACPVQISGRVEDYASEIFCIVDCRQRPDIVHTGEAEDGLRTGGIAARRAIERRLSVIKRTSVCAGVSQRAEIGMTAVSAAEAVQHFQSPGRVVRAMYELEHLAPAGVSDCPSPIRRRAVKIAFLVHDKRR